MGNIAESNKRKYAYVLWILLNIAILIIVLLAIGRFSFGQIPHTIPFFFLVIFINVLFVYDFKEKLTYILLSAIWFLAWAFFLVFMLFPSGLSASYLYYTSIRIFFIFVIFSYPILLKVLTSLSLKKKINKKAILLFFFAIILSSFLFGNLKVPTQYSRAYPEDPEFLKGYIKKITPNNFEIMNDQEKMIFLTTELHNRFAFKFARISSATNTLKRGYGTCSSQALALKKLASLLGYPSRIIVLGLKHVVVEVYFDRKWNLLDPQLGTYYKLGDGRLSNALDLHNNRSLIKEEEYKSRYDAIFVVENGFYQKVTEDNVKLIYGKDSEIK